MSSIRVGTAPSTSSSRDSARKTTPSSSSTKNHPPVSDMVNQALLEIKARGGSSMTAIKKYIADTYKVDGDKMKPYIKRYVKTSLETGRLVQTKGQGAAGSFRLGTKTMHQMTTSKISKPKVTKLKTKRSSPKKAKKPTIKGRSKKKVQKSSGKRSSLSKVSRSSAAKKRKSTKSKKSVAKKKTSTPKKGRR